LLNTIKNAIKIAEIRKRLIMTLILIAILSIGRTMVTVPNVNKEAIKQLYDQGTTGFLSFLNLLSGGGLTSFSVFALAVGPYINSSIIVQLLTVIIPKLEQLSKEGEEGRKKIQELTKYLAVVFAIVQSIAQIAIINSMININILNDTSFRGQLLVILILTTGAVFLVWFADQITQYGVGNGVSLIIFINIISSLPGALVTIYQNLNQGTRQAIMIILFVVMFLILLLSVIYVSLAERRIPVQYAGKTAANGKMFKGQSTFIPISITASCVIGIIFANSVLQFPQVILQFFPDSKANELLIKGIYSPFNHTSVVYPFVLFIVIIFFVWFYTLITMKPDEMAENMHKSAGFIPGIRPGVPTEKYIEKTLNKVSAFAGVFAGIIAVVPIIASIITKNYSLSLGGTSLLIVIGVATEIIKQIESQLAMRHTSGFLKR